jgi:hypothetical protein
LNRTEDKIGFVKCVDLTPGMIREGCVFPRLISQSLESIIELHPVAHGVKDSEIKGTTDQCARRDSTRLTRFCGFTHVSWEDIHFNS